MKKAFLTVVLILVMMLVLSITGYSAGSRSYAATEAATQAAFAAHQDVEIPMEDGIKIQGTFYTTTGSEKAPAVLLLHQNGGSRIDWLPLVPYLTTSGYNVLNVDQRGFGQTKGGRSWELGISDAAAMMAWLHTQPTVDPTRIAVIGGSVGSNVAIRVCAEDDQCHVAIALSPGLNFFNIPTKEAVQDMSGKSMLFVAGQRDADSAQSVKSLGLFAALGNNIMTRLYSNSSNHATALLSPELDQLIVSWLELYNTGH